MSQTLWVIHRNKNHDFLESIMKEGFILGKGEYAAIPFGNQLMVIHNGEQLKVCRTESSARNFIQQHKKQQGGTSKVSL
jgi:hypothetical protein